MYDSASVEGACSEDFGAPVSGRVGVANCCAGAGVFRSEERDLGRSCLRRGLKAYHRVMQGG